MFTGSLSLETTPSVFVISVLFHREELVWMVASGPGSFPWRGCWVVSHVFSQQRPLRSPKGQDNGILEQLQKCLTCHQGLLQQINEAQGASVLPESHGRRGLV